jgi:hypothetical protein
MRRREDKRRRQAGANVGQRANAVVPGYPKCCRRCMSEYNALRLGRGHLIDERIEEIALILAGI